eukprot:Ihof_evm1s991 gene=Ihof_evmTU1s991
MAGKLTEAMVMTVLNNTLLQIHRQVQIKDAYAIFAAPVDPNTARGYEDMIKYPMDLSTMFAKIEANEYSTIADYQSDFNIMCDNAIAYNLDTTIYHKAALKLKAAGAKIIGKETHRYNKRLAALLQSQKEQSSRLDDDIDIMSTGGTVERASENDEYMDIDGGSDRPRESSDVDSVKSRKRKKGSKKSHSGSKNTEDTTAQDILDAVKAQAESAASTIKQNTSLGTKLVMDSKGNLVWGCNSLSHLNFLPMDAKCVQATQNVRAESPLYQFPVPKLDKEVNTIPVRSLLYGPYASFQPNIDTARAQLTVSQSEAINDVFGDVKGYEYSRGLMAMARAIGPQAIQRAEKTLINLSEGKFKPHMWPEVDIWSDLDKLTEADAQPVKREELICLQDLKKEGITVPDFTRVLEQPKPRNITTNQELLDDTAGLLWELEKTQLRRIRLAKTSESYTPKELAIAQEVVFRLTALMDKTTPSSVGASAATNHISQAAPPVEGPASHTSAHHPQTQSQPQSQQHIQSQVTMQSHSIPSSQPQGQSQYITQPQHSNHNAHNNQSYHPAQQQVSKATY